MATKFASSPIPLVHGQALLDGTWHESAPKSEFETRDFGSAAQQCQRKSLGCALPEVMKLGFHEFQAFTARVAKGVHEPTLSGVQDSSVKVAGHFFLQAVIMGMINVSAGLVSDGMPGQQEAGGQMHVFTQNEVRGKTACLL